MILCLGVVPNGASIPTKTTGASRVKLAAPGTPPVAGSWGWLSDDVPGTVELEPQSSGMRYRVCQFLESTVAADGTVKAWVNIVPQGMKG
jgi:hypothetical protein